MKRRVSCCQGGIDTRNDLIITCFSYTKEEASRDQASITVNETLRHHADADQHSDDREPDRRTEALQKNVGRDLEESVRDEKDGKGEVVLVRSELEVLLETYRRALPIADLSKKLRR